MLFSVPPYSYSEEGAAEEVAQAAAEAEPADDEITNEAVFEEEPGADITAPPFSDMMVKAIINEDFEKMVDLIQLDLRKLDDSAEIDNNTKSLLTVFLKRQMADIYAWRLKDPNKAIGLYKENIAALKQYNETADNKIAEVEYYLIAQIYEEYGNKAKAQKLYERFFKFSMAMAIDGIVDSARKKGGHITQKDIDIINEAVSQYSNFITSGFQKNGISKLRPNSHESTALFTSLSLALFSPSGLVDLILVAEKGPFEVIIKSPANLSSEMSVFVAFQTTLMAEGLTEENLKAADGFIKKFPKSYFTMLMAHQLYWHYLNEGEKPKAVKYYKTMQSIEEKRGIDIILTRNKKLGTPEEVWKILKRAVLDNDLKTVESLLLPGHFNTDNFDLSKDKEIGAKFAMIEKIKMHRESPNFVRFEIIYDKSETEKAAFNIYFVKSYGEWRVDSGEHENLPGIAGIGHHKGF